VIENKSTMETVEDMEKMRLPTPLPTMQMENVPKTPEPIKEEQEEKINIAEEDEDEDVEALSPSPSAAAQKFKRWSKMIKDNLPTMNVTNASSSANVGSSNATKTKKSLKEKFNEADLASFLKERRPVSESRFRAGSADEMTVAAPVTVSTQTPTANVTSGSSVNMDTLRRRFESGGGSGRAHELTSSNMVRSAMTKKETEEEQQSTSPESGVERSDSESKARKKDKKKKEKEKKKHSTCTACNASNANSKEQKKSKKTKSKDKKAVTIANGDARKPSEERPALPPYPKVIDDWTKRGERGSHFYRQLFIKDQPDINANNPSNTPKQPQQQRDEAAKDRQPRSALKKTTTRPPQGISSPLKSTTPTLNAYLQERRMVSGSIFRSRSYYDRHGTLPISMIRSEKFFDARSRFQNGHKPVATFPRSVSNLERKSGGKRQQSGSPQGRTVGNVEGKQEVSASSTVTVEVASEPRSRSAGATPRPNSAMSDRSLAASDRSLGGQSQVDREEYKNYVLEVLHSTPKSERFQQLQNYYNLLDKALKLEKKSTSMEVHKLKSDQVLDFETWRSLRGKEKAAEELSSLLTDLKMAQKQREFLWRPKDAAELKWRGDAHLRGRDKSVEILKNKFIKIAAENGATDEIRIKLANMQETKDTYRPFWRAKSVSDVAADGEKKAAEAEGKEDEETVKTIATEHEHDIDRPANDSVTSAAGVSAAGASAVGVSASGVSGRDLPTRWPRSACLPPRSRSSLTSCQVSMLKDQLNEIFGASGQGTSTGGAPNVLGSMTSVTLSHREANPTLVTVREKLEGKRLFAKPLPDLVRRSQKSGQEDGREQTDLGQVIDGGDDGERKRLSLQIGAELRELRASPKRESSPVLQSLAKQSEDERQSVTKPIVHGVGDKTTKEREPEDSKSSKSEAKGNIIRETKSGEGAKPSNRTSSKQDPGGWGNQRSSESLSSSGASAGTVIYRQSTGNPINAKDGQPPIGQGRKRSVEELRRSFETLTKAEEEEESIKLLYGAEGLRRRYHRSPPPAPPPPGRSASFNRADFSRKRLALLTSGQPRSRSAEERTREESPATKYSRSYLSLVRAGEVARKRGILEDFGAFYDDERMAVTPTKQQMAHVDLDYITARLTDLSRPLVRRQEEGDVQGLRRRLEARGERLREQAGAAVSHSRAKLKHLCRRVGHAKILGKMVSLHDRSKEEELDAGTTELFLRAAEERDYLERIRSGDVEAKAGFFDAHLASADGFQPSSFSELDRRYPFEPAPTFSWSRRFESSLPRPKDEYTTAQRHGGFRAYYGYLPSEVAANVIEGREALRRRSRGLPTRVASLSPTRLPAESPTRPPQPSGQGNYSISRSLPGLRQPHSPLMSLSGVASSGDRFVRVSHDEDRPLDLDFFALKHASTQTDPSHSTNLISHLNEETMKPLYARILPKRHRLDRGKKPRRMTGNTHHSTDMCIISLTILFRTF
jgi:hypothetical protein